MDKHSVGRGERGGGRGEGGCTTNAAEAAHKSFKTTEP